MTVAENKDRGDGPCGVVVSSHVPWAVWSQQMQMQTRSGDAAAASPAGAAPLGAPLQLQVHWTQLPPLHSPEKEEVQMQERVGFTFVLSIIGGCVLATHGAVALSDFPLPLPTVLVTTVWAMAGVATLCLWMLLHTTESSATIQRSEKRCLPIPPAVETLLLQGLPLSYADLNLRKLQCMSDATGECSFDADDPRFESLPERQDNIKDPALGSYCVSKNEKFCYEKEEFCILNEELCIKNEELFVSNDEFCRCGVWSGGRRTNGHSTANHNRNAIVFEFSIEKCRDYGELPRVHF